MKPANDCGRPSRRAGTPPAGRSPSTPGSSNREPGTTDFRARELIGPAHSVLDIGTGGGERFERYCSDYAGYAAATEAWPPNAPVASARLRARGIDVVLCDDESLPFAAESFDLVLNRHAALTPADVARVL